jgi:hypothetical protein
MADRDQARHPERAERPDDDEPRRHLSLGHGHVVLGMQMYGVVVERDRRSRHSSSGNLDHRGLILGHLAILL